MKTLASIVCLTILLATMGCSGDASRGIVSGKVTYQGEPVAEGQIIFRLPDNSIVEGAIIEDGKFESPAPVGNCLVQITAIRRIDVRPNPAMPDGIDFATVAYIPQQYNDKSTLNLEVTPGKQSHDFDLKQHLPQCLALLSCLSFNLESDRSCPLRSLVSAHMIFRQLLAVLAILLIVHDSHADDIVVLDQEPSGESLRKSEAPLLLWQATRDKPLPNVFSVFRVDLKHPDYEIVVMVGEDPDGDGPADAVLTEPSQLMQQHQAIAAINANAFSRVMDADRFRDWYPGMPVNILGLATSDGVIHSTLEPSKRAKTHVAFWVDDTSRGSIERPASGFTPTEAVGDFYGYLLNDGKVTTWEAGQRHPRTALGIDLSGRYLYLVVVDGRRKGYSTGTTMAELASFMQSLGCYKAINLDGGGSSIMLYQDHATGQLQTANRPSSGEHRPVPVMLGVRAKQSSR